MADAEPGSWYGVVWTHLGQRCLIDCDTEATAHALSRAIAEAGRDAVAVLGPIVPPPTAKADLEAVMARIARGIAAHINAPATDVPLDDRGLTP